MLPMSLREVYGPRWPWLLALYFSLATICGYVSWSRVVIDEKGTVYTNQTSVDVLVSTVSEKPEGTAVWPQIRSRVLVPYLLVGAKKYLGVSYRVTHDGTRLIFIFLSAVLFHWHLRTWFSLHEALTGTALLLGTITITFNTWFPVATDFPELVGMTISAALLVRQRWVWMLVALSVYTLNRETSIILLGVAVCVLYRGRRSIPRVLAIAAGIFMTWWFTYMAARHLAGVGDRWFLAPEVGGWNHGFVRELIGLFQHIWTVNLVSIRALLRKPHPYNVNWSFFLVLNVFWALPLIAWRSIPIPLRRLYVGGLLGGFTIFSLAGILNEAGRLMIPIYPLIYPAGLYALFRYVTPPDSRVGKGPMEGLKEDFGRPHR